MHSTLSPAVLKLTMAWSMVIFLLLPAQTRGETAVQAWVQRYNGPGNGDDQARVVAVDGSNNVIVTGYSASTNGYPSNYDYLTIKYSSAGVPLWTNRYHAGVANAVAVDGSNDVIVTGWWYGGGMYNDCLTIKYSSAGLPLWTNCYSGLENGDDQARVVAVDGSNNVIVTGYSASTNAYPYNYDYLTIKYSSAGIPLWTNRYNGPGNTDDEAIAVAVDGSNNVIVTGHSVGSKGNNDYATIQYSSAGVPLWTNRYSGPGNGYNLATAVAVDGRNNVIVTGYSLGSGSHEDYATIQYSSEGVPLWTNRYDGPGNGLDEAAAVVVDGSNNVIVTGYSSGSSSSGYDYATVKYSSAGEPLWTNRYNGPASESDEATSVSVDTRNNVIATGFSFGSGSYDDYTTIHYSSAGAPLWTNRYNGPGNWADQAVAVAVDHSNNVIVTGLSLGSGGDYDFATIKYVCVPEPVLTALQPTNGTFQLRVEDVLQPGTLVIEASTNLAGWAPVFTNTIPTNTLFYTDPDATNFSWRFYRAFQFP